MDKIKDLVSQNKLKEAFNELDKHMTQIEDSDVKNNLIILKSRYTSIADAHTSGTIDFCEYTKHINIIVSAILNFIDNNFKQNVSIKDDGYNLLLEQSWNKFIKQGFSSKLIYELNSRIKTLKQLTDSKYKIDYSNEITGLESIISPELSRCYNLFPFDRINKNKDSSSFVGIDFGTSTTVISYIVYYPECTNFSLSKPQPIELSFLKPSKRITHLIPSALFYDDDDKSLLFGVDAKYYKPDRHNAGINYWTSFKTKLGVYSENKYPNSELNNNESLPSITTSEDVAVEYFKWLKKRIESFIFTNNFPKNICYAVSIPASFGTNKRKTYLKVLEKAGIKIADNYNNKNTVFIDEPNAAFLSALLDFDTEQLHHISNKNILVFDFGAGTCDISIMKFVEFGKNSFKSIHLGSSTDVPLGGDDIDLAIVKSVLYKQFTDDAGLSSEHITELDKQFNFEPNLISAAEQLKILISKKLSKNSEWIHRESDTKSISSDIPISIRYNDNNYNNDGLTLSYKDFHQIMQTFLDERQSKKTIFHPINTALKNCKLNKLDIDYVLLIGGSCYNPYISNTLKEYFPNSVIIKPSDLQSHVSVGVCLHSAFMYGANISVIRPVVSETISFKSLNGLVPLVEAGTPIPSQEKILTNLKCQSNQSFIDVPIYSSGSELIFNMHKIDGNFSPTDNITLKVYVDNNKIIHLRVLANNIEISKIEFEPFPTDVFTPYERDVKNYENIIQDHLIKKESMNSYVFKDNIAKLVQLHGKCHNYIKAMETLINYSPEEFTSISYYASLAGKEDLKFKYKKLALEKNRSDVTLYNFANEFDANSPEHEKYMKESSDLNFPPAQFSYGKVLIQKGEREKGNTLINKAFNHFHTEYQFNEQGLEDWEYGILKNIASYLNKNDLVNKINMTLDKIHLHNNKELHDIFNTNYLLMHNKDLPIEIFNKN